MTKKPNEQAPKGPPAEGSGGAGGAGGAWGTTVYRCGALRDACGTDFRPGTVTVRDGRITAVAPPTGPADAPAAPTDVVDLPRMLVMPAMVNAHVHLDLTALGVQPYDGDFVDWVGRIMAWRQRHDPQPATTDVRQGLAMSLGAGVGWVGDIAGSDEALAAFLEADSPGVSFLECFGLGRRQAEAIAALTKRLAELTTKEADTISAGNSARSCRSGIQPHAPYSAGLELYEAAATAATDGGWPLSTHLAEIPEELRFVRDAAGPFAERLRDWGKWDDTITGSGLHPVDWLRPQLARRRWLLAHCNYLDDKHIRILADCHAAVAYCPIASDYFGHPPGGHRYRDLLAAGVNVCLGTDSILCQGANEAQPLGILPQMRHLYRRDGGGSAAAATLLKMATVNGLEALGLDPLHAALRPGTPARLIAVPFDPGDPADALTQVLENDYPVQPISGLNVEE